MTRLRQGYGAAGLRRRQIAALIALAVALALASCGRARHVGGWRIRFVVLRLDGEGVRERRTAAASALA